MNRFGSLVVSAGLLLPVAVGTGCGGDESFDLAAAAEYVRQLPLDHDVEVVEMTREEFAAKAAERADNISDEYLAYYADTYGRLGFFDRSLDLRPAFAGGSSDWVGAQYWPGSDKMILVGDTRDDQVVHEYVHALQDQNFVLNDYDAPETSDSFLARRAVVEGDATLAQARYVAVYEWGKELDAVDWVKTFDFYRNVIDAGNLADATYPVVFLDYVSFVYDHGLEYTAKNLLGVTYEEPAAPPPLYDWSLEDELFTQRPPDTTERVLLRDIYLDSADPVVPVGLTDVPDGLTDRLQALDWDVLGAWYVYLLFYPLDKAGTLDARALAAAWDGDHALFVRDTDTGQAATVWASAWDDEETAARVVDALWELHGYHDLKGYPAPMGRSDDGELTWIERRGTLVVSVKNLPPDLAAPLVDEAFAGPTTARRRSHLSLPEALRRRFDKAE